MSEWNEVRLGELIDINPETLSVSKYNGKIQYIDIASVNRGQLDGYTEYDIVDAPSRARRIIRNNDIIYSTVRPNLRAYYYVKNCPDNAICSTGFAVLRAKDNVDSRFIYSLVTENSFVDYLSLVAKGSAYPAADTADFKKAKVTVPNLPTQARIADILSTYDDLIENNNRRIALLEKAAQELYKEWFVRFRFPGYTTIKFENGLPLGWEFRSVEDISAVLQRGISPIYADDGESWVINQKCIRKSIMDISEARKQTKAFKPILNLQDGDTVICSTGTGTLGRVGQVYGDYPHTTFDSHVTMVRAKEGVGKHFLYYSLKNLQPWFMSMGIGSTNQQELYRKTIKNAKVVVPNIGLMNMFEEHISTIHNQIILLSKSTECATKQRDMLLPRLMSGKLEV